MSGPKTSELEIERRIQARIATLRRELGDEQASRLAEVEAAMRRFEERAQGVAGTEDVLSMVRSARETARIAILANDVSASHDLAATERAVTAATKAIEAAMARFRTTMREQEERLDALRGAMRSAQEATGLAEALTRADAGLDAAGITRLVALAANHGRQAEEGADVETTLRHATELLQSRSTTQEDRALLAGTLRTLATGAASAAAISSQLEELYPAVEARSRALAELQARIEAAEASLRDAGQTTAEKVLPASLEKAQQRLDAAQAALGEADRRHYLQDCIDECMRRHGYDVRHSVVLGTANLGHHFLFQGDDHEDAIHAFMSDAGDLMLEIVAVDDASTLEEGTQVLSRPSTSVLQQERLLQAQHEFCSVYEEIAADLAGFGIHNVARNLAEPDLRHCKVMGRAQEWEATGTQHAQALGRERRRAQEPQARRMS